MKTIILTKETKQMLNFISVLPKKIKRIERYLLFTYAKQK